MKKLSSSLLNMVLSLGIITIVAAALLAWVFSITSKPIEEAAKQKQIEAIKSVTPDFDNDPLAQCEEWTPKGQTEPFSIFPAYKDGKFVGAAVEGYSLNGFSGEVRIMYGFNAAGDITGYEVLSQAETPGLGAKMQEWFKMQEGNRSVIGKNPATTSMYVTKDPGGEIDAITAATISSRAFLGALRDCYDAFEAYKNEHNL
jgi:electron transport complex protein RnfG